MCMNLHAGGTMTHSGRELLARASHGVRIGPLSEAAGELSCLLVALLVGSGCTAAEPNSASTTELDSEAATYEEVCLELMKVAQRNREACGANTERIDETHARAWCHGQALHLDAGMRLGHVAIDPDGLRACLDVHRAGGCSYVTCGSVVCSLQGGVVGLRREGDWCTSRVGTPQCEPGTYCGFDATRIDIPLPPNVDAASCPESDYIDYPGVCTRLKQAGQACDPNQGPPCDFEAGYECRGGTCVALAVRGEPCNDATGPSCQVYTEDSYVMCHESRCRTSVASTTVDGRCGAISDREFAFCPLYQSCDRAPGQPTGTCKPTALPGLEEACTYTFGTTPACAPGLWCQDEDNPHCRAPLAVGDACDPDHLCQAGSRCRATEVGDPTGVGHCRLDFDGPDGAACMDDTYCASQACLCGTCRDPRKYGLLGYVHSAM